MQEDKEAVIIDWLRKIAKEIEYGEFKITFKVHQGKMAHLREEHSERVTVIG